MNNKELIPDSWASIEEFTDWYLSVGTPIYPPADAQVYITDTTYSSIIFRHDVFQVEYYIIKPNSYIPPHRHDDFNNMIIFLSGEMYGERHKTLEEFDGILDREYESLATAGRLDNNIKDLSKPHYQFLQYGIKLYPGEYHAVRTFERGACFLSIEQWVTKNNFLSSASISYNGTPLGPMHAADLEKRKLTVPD